jgi:hypothetical protein
MVIVERGEVPLRTADGVDESVGRTSRSRRELRSEPPWVVLEVGSTCETGDECGMLRFDVVGVRGDAS